MDRVFLDANILFAAAWRPKSALRRLFDLDDAELLSSSYAVEEARYFRQEVGGVLILPPAEYPPLIRET
jgi:hypothetical protein